MRFVFSLNSRRFTGLLHVESGNRLLSFSFRDGDVVFVEERTGGVFRSEDSVAQQLVRQRVLTPEQYTEVIERMEGIAIASVDAAFCDIAVRLRYLEPRQVYQAFTGRIRARLVEAVGWRQCALQVDDSPAALSGHEQFPVPPLPLLYQAIRGSYDQQRVFDCCSLHPEYVVRLTGPPVSLADRFALNRDELRLLRACDGVTRVALLIEYSALDPLHAWQLLCLLDLSASLKVEGRDFPVASPSPLIKRPASVSEGTRSKPAFAVKRLAADLEMRRSARPAPAQTTRPATRGQDARISPVPVQNLPAMDSLARELMKRKLRQTTLVAPGVSDTRPESAPVRPPAAGWRTNSAHPPPASFRPPANSVKPASVISGPNRPGSSRPGFDRPGSSRPGFDRPGSSRPGFNRPGSTRAGGSRSARPHSAAPSRTSYIEGVLKRPAGGEAGGLHADRAVEVFESGRSYLRAKDYESARDEFLLAHELEPRQGVYRMYYLWAALRAENRGGAVGRYPDELKRLAHSHTCIHGHIGFAYFVLGQLALSDGNERAAEKHFKDAIDNDPDQPEAQHQYRLLVRRRERS